MSREPDSPILTRRQQAQIENDDRLLHRYLWALEHDPPCAAEMVASLDRHGTLGGGPSAFGRVDDAIQALTGQVPQYPEPEPLSPGSAVKSEVTGNAKVKQGGDEKPELKDEAESKPPCKSEDKPDTPDAAGCKDE